jgi:hypothetical protein
MYLGKLIVSVASFFRLQSNAEGVISINHPKKAHNNVIFRLLGDTKKFVFKAMFFAQVHHNTQPVAFKQFYYSYAPVYNL